RLLREHLEREIGPLAGEEADRTRHGFLRDDAGTERAGDCPRRSTFQQSRAPRTAAWRPALARLGYPPPVLDFATLEWGLPCNSELAPVTWRLRCSRSRVERGSRLRSPRRP